MTLVLENSWNSKKVQFVLELSLNLEKNLDNHKKSLKMIETVFLGAVRNKNQENCKIGNRNKCGAIFSGFAAMVFYSILFDSSSTNQMQPEVKPCKAEIGKGKNESSVRRQYATLKSGRNNELERQMHLRS